MILKVAEIKWRLEIPGKDGKSTSTVE